MVLHNRLVLCQTMADIPLEMPRIALCCDACLFDYCHMFVLAIHIFEMGPVAVVVDLPEDRLFLF